MLSTSEKNAFTLLDFPLILICSEMQWVLQETWRYYKIVVENRISTQVLVVSVCGNFFSCLFVLVTSFFEFPLILSCTCCSWPRIRFVTCQSRIHHPSGSRPHLETNEWFVSILATFQIICNMSLLAHFRCLKYLAKNHLKEHKFERLVASHCLKQGQNAMSCANSTLLMSRVKMRTATWYY